MRGNTRNETAQARRDARRRTRWTLLLLPWCLSAVLPAAVAAQASDATQERLIEVLYDDALSTDGLDANADNALTVADIVLLGARPTPTPTETLPPTPTATPTTTPTGTLYTGTISELLPHGVGDILYYKVTDGFQQVADGYAETVSSDPSGAFRVIDGFIDSQNNKSPSEATTYRDTGTELYLTGSEIFSIGTNVTCTPNLLHLKIPVIAGQTFTTKATCVGGLGGGGLRYVRTDSFTPIEIRESYTVPAGTYTNVLHVRGTIAQVGFPLEQDDLYIAPGVGVIFQTAVAQLHLIVKRELTDGMIGGLSVKQP